MEKRNTFVASSLSCWVLWREHSRLYSRSWWSEQSGKQRVKSWRCPLQSHWLVDDYPELPECERLDWLCVNGAVMVASAGVDRPTVLHSLSSQLGKLELVTTELFYQCRITRICKNGLLWGTLLQIKWEQSKAKDRVQKEPCSSFVPLMVLLTCRVLQAHTHTE